MNAEEVARACDELHECVDEGPGDNPEAYARALSVLRRLRADVCWEYPTGILAQIELRFGHWFSAAALEEADSTLFARDELIEQIARLEDAWDSVPAAIPFFPEWSNPLK